MAKPFLGRRPAAVELERDDIQGILLDPYSTLPEACFLLLHIDDAAAARRWLAALPVTSTHAYRRQLAASALNVAISWPGLQALRGADIPVLYAAREFREGMVTDHRSRVLGDRDQSAPPKWRWRGDAGVDVPVDIILMAYAGDPAALARLIQRVAGEPARDGLRVVQRIDAVHLAGEKEHFGFRDGIGQPLVQGDSEGKAGDQLVAAGEFILGYPNGFGGFSLSPAVPGTEDGAGVFSASPVDASARDIGKNGSFLVFRQLAQDVPAFWAFARDAVESEGKTAAAEPVALAAKMVGRWPSGAPILLHPDRDPGQLADDDTFSYAERDPDGYLVPLGSHIRRANPRDALVDNVNESHTIVGHHRILRRARSYGPPLDSTMDSGALIAARPDGTERGLNFICFNADIGRQFQFVQHAWMNSAKFSGLYQDSSPLLGDREPNSLATTFTVQGTPVRRRYPGLEQFVTVRGGGYFFLPGLKALRFLAGESR